MQKDLSSSPHQEFVPDTEDAEASMLRRAVGKIPHVGIIGAGVAGLRCADVLLQHGVKVTILEARNRVGGRVSRPTRLQDQTYHLHDTALSKRCTWSHS
jgi:monoamine oxidase